MVFLPVLPVPTGETMKRAMLSVVVGVILLSIKNRVLSVFSMDWGRYGISRSVYECNHLDEFGWADVSSKHLTWISSNLRSRLKAQWWRWTVHLGLGG